MTRFREVEKRLYRASWASSPSGTRSGVSSEAMAEAWGGVSSEGEGGSEGSPYFPLPKFRAPYFNSDYIFVSIICVSMVRPRLSDSPLMGLCSHQLGCYLAVAVLLSGSLAFLTLLLLSLYRKNIQGASTKKNSAFCLFRMSKKI
jgi:hypothetical protein